MPDSDCLIRPLFDGPVDLIGDVHGEINALQQLLGHLGYDTDGRHEEGRRLIFIGDLVDRGPDTPAVLHLVRRLVDRGRAQAVMGNHELNLLRGKRRAYNHWFYPTDDTDPDRTDQRVMPESERGRVMDWLRTLPLGLEREDLRAVHACWQASAADALRTHRDALDAFLDHEQRITAELEQRGVTDPVERNLAHQNQSPVKVFTSGLEHRAQQPFEAGECLRREARTPWWLDYHDQPFCVFGHYSRTQPASQNGGSIPLFPGSPFTAFHHTMCIDFAVGSRAEQRRNGPTHGTVALAALRWPERQIVLDTGDMVVMAVDQCSNTTCAGAR